MSVFGLLLHPDAPRFAAVSVEGTRPSRFSRTACWPLCQTWPH